MGGMAEGGRCADIAISTFLLSLIFNDWLSPKERVAVAARVANDEVYRQYRERGGTTVAGVFANDDSVLGVTVGDSRIYAIHQQKPPTQIGSDDTLSDQLQKVTGRVAVGVTDPFAGQLTQFVGMGEGIQPHTNWIRGNESYLLTSDGIHGISAPTFNDIVSAAENPRELVTRLVTVSRWCGGRDNASAVLISTARVRAVLDAPNSGWLEIWDPFSKLDTPVTRQQLQDLNGVFFREHKLFSGVSADGKRAENLLDRGPQPHQNLTPSAHNDTPPRSASPKKSKSSRSKGKGGKSQLAKDAIPAKSGRMLEIEISEATDQSIGQGENTGNRLANDAEGKENSQGDAEDAKPVSDPKLTFDAPSTNKVESDPSDATTSSEAPNLRR